MNIRYLLKNKCDFKNQTVRDNQGRSNPSFEKNDI